MQALVRIALQRPYTFAVLAVLILLGGVLSILRTPTDIFPNINIPVIAAVWQYAGLAPDEMSGRIMTPYERALTTTVNNIEHIEAVSYSGFGVVKVFFQPAADIRTANSQVVAVSQTILKSLPPGITPPLVLNYNASTVPIIQLALAGKGMSEQTLSDLGTNFIRTQLVTVPGAAVPLPFGGKTREVQIDLHPSALQAFGMSGEDVALALAAQNLVLPAGTQKIGRFEYTIQLNNAPSEIGSLADLPVKVVHGATIYLRDVADVRDGYPPQTNIVHVDGARSVLLTVEKSGSVSTLAIIKGIKAKIAQLQDGGLPSALQIRPIADQSIFVSAAISSVVRESVIAGALTSLMIMLFLASWRSTLIIATSIPLAILGSITTLSFIGETLNIMTLGGLALAVGILVDDATVTIENINWHLERGAAVEVAILEGAGEIATPAFVSTLSICIAFVPMFFLPGVAGFLFLPLAEAVIFAMIFSFVLSRTLVPTVAKYLLRRQGGTQGAGDASGPVWNQFLVRFQRSFARGYERLWMLYRSALQLALTHRRGFLAGFLSFVFASFLLVPLVGSNFFPDVDSGQILMHVRLQVGTRVEESAAAFGRIQRIIRTIIPPEELDTLVDNIGMPVSGINLAYNNTGTIGEQDGDIQISLKPQHRPTAEYVGTLREVLPNHFPGVTFSFLPADIVSQILNFGAPAPINVQVRGAAVAADYVYAHELLRRVRLVPGVADARIEESQSYPGFKVNVDRSLAQYVGLTERDVTNNLLVLLAGNSQVQPTFWLNPANGVQYPIVMQEPQYEVSSIAELRNLPIRSEGAAAAQPPQVIGGLATVKRMASSAAVAQYNIQRTVQIYAATRARDLGAVSADIDKILKETAQERPKGSSVALLGLVQTMNSSYIGLVWGLLGAVVLIYLLIVVNFQSWSDPFVIITALPAALAGIVWMLFATGTTFSVPALTGAIMCMGVATANSVLVIAFARERLAALGDPVAAALEAGSTRFRPVLMTALAMIIGMVPMALGLGDGGEQNAPLGRAVIGGLLFATVSTLIFVPVVFTIVHRKPVRTESARAIEPAPVPGAQHVS
jgi:multidrug efflux pump subunit AcrB